MCVVHRGSRQGRLANNTPSALPLTFPLPTLRSLPSLTRRRRRPLLPVISCSRPMPANEKGKKVPKIQNPGRKSSSMNASTRRRLALPWLPRNSSSSSYLPIFHVRAPCPSSSSSSHLFLGRVRGARDHAPSPFYNALENARTRVRLSS